MTEYEGHEFERFHHPAFTKARWVVLEPFVEGYKGLAIDYGPGGKFKVITDFTLERDAIAFVNSYPDRDLSYRYEEMGWNFGER